ncbi:hypothetical protein DFH07DRAFT_1027419, partial [Mycena maculata]
HKLVKQPKELTDRIWKNIKAPLVEFLTEKKKERLEIQRVRAIKERHLLAGNIAYATWLKTFPPRREVVTAEPFRAIIQDTPIEEKVTEDSFATALSQVPAFSDDWKRRKDQELLRAMKEHVPNSVEADLHLATTFFASSGGSVGYGYTEPIGYPRILVHRKASVLSYHNGISQPIKKLFDQDYWNAAGLIRFHRSAFLNVRSVIETCGLDPDVTTAAEMNEINPAMECLNCSNDSLGRLVMRWFQTATHFCQNPAQLNVAQTKANWKCLKRDDEFLVGAQEQQTFELGIVQKQYGFAYWQDDFCCKFCDLHPTTFTSVAAHVRDPQHGHFDSSKCQIPH